MWKKTLFILSLVLLCVISTPNATAVWDGLQECQVGTSCTITQFVTNSSLQAQPQSSCNVTIRNETTLLVNASPLTATGLGWHNASFIPNETGIYPTTVLCGFQNTTAQYVVTFLAQKGVSRFMAFELAVPLVFLVLAGLSFGAMLYFTKNPSAKYRFATIAVQHGMAILALLFVILGVFSTGLIMSYENVAANTSLTSISNLLDLTFRILLGLFGFIFAIIFTLFIMRTLTLWTTFKLEKVQRQEDS